MLQRLLYHTRKNPSERRQKTLQQSGEVYRLRAFEEWVVEWARRQLFSLQD